MTYPLAIWLGAVGVADLVADLSGHPQNRSRVAAGWAIATAITPVAMLLAGYGAGWAAAMTGIVAVTLGPWLLGRAARGWSRARAVGVFWWLAVVLVVLVGALGRWPAPSTDPLFARWVSLLPPALVGLTPPDQVALVMGAVIWLAASANAVVRLVLASVARDVLPGEEPLRGGRIIGPMERWLIFGLVLAGAATAAGLVVGAKGLIRYAEIRGPDVQWKTEYLLVGSLTSWLLALLPVVLVR